jgi:hypothetical protein
MKLKIRKSLFTRADLSNSIYQQSGANFGLTVNKGMLINNRPDGQTGIQQAAQLKSEVKRAKKIDMYAEAVMLGNMRSEMSEGPEIG